MEMSFVTIKARIAEDQSDDRRRFAALPVELDAQDARARRRAASKRRCSTSPRAASWPSPTAHFEVGSRVWLMLPGRERANAVVKWTAGDKLGAEFAEPISLEDLERLTFRLVRASARLVAVSALRSASTRPVRCNRAPSRSLSAAERKVAMPITSSDSLEAL